MSKLSEEHILRSLGLGFGADDDDFDDEAALQGVDSDPEELTVRRGMERSFFLAPLLTLAPCADCCSVKARGRRRASQRCGSVGTLRGGWRRETLTPCRRWLASRRACGPS